MSHTDVHNHLTGAEPLDTSSYSHVVSIRKENLTNWKGYEVISDSTDSYLIGKKKSFEALKKDADLKTQKEFKEKQRIVDQEKKEKDHQAMIEESKKKSIEDEENRFKEAVEKRVREEIEKLAIQQPEEVKE